MQSYLWFVQAAAVHIRGNNEFNREFNDDLFALTSAFVPFLAIGLSENETKLLKRRMELEF